MPAEIRRVCVFGAGSIGSLLAGHLASVCEVSVLTRRPEHAARLNQDGLRISGKSGGKKSCGCLAKGRKPSEPEETDEQAWRIAAQLEKVQALCAAMRRAQQMLDDWASHPLPADKP